MSKSAETKPKRTRKEPIPEAIDEAYFPEAEAEAEAEAPVEAPAAPRKTRRQRVTRGRG